MLLSDLQDAKLKTAGGKLIGRVHEVHCDGGRIVALMCGPGSFIERLTAKNGGRRIPWESVLRVEERQVIVELEPPRRGVSASRSRRGTRRPSAPRSKR